MADVSDAKIKVATECGERDQQTEARAESVRYDPATAKLVIVLLNCTEVQIPVRLLQGLKTASEKDLNDVQVQGAGYGLYWPALDIDLSVPGVLAGVFGTQKHMAKIAGRAKSNAKAAAARENGRKGGRPRKPKAAAA